MRDKKDNIRVSHPDVVPFHECSLIYTFSYVRKKVKQTGIRVDFSQDPLYELNTDVFEEKWCLSLGVQRLVGYTSGVQSVVTVVLGFITPETDEEFEVKLGWTEKKETRLVSPEENLESVLVRQNLCIDGIGVDRISPVNEKGIDPYETETEK